ncbi:MAG: N-acetylmuramoyl-L-alanine amidase family protein [Candidatus Fimenecus sp.]
MAEILEMLAPVGCKCRPANALTPEYITIHNTANTNATADAVAHANLLRGSWKDKSISWHYAVDENKIVQCVPDTENAWHAGDGGNGTGNRKSLAIEICENGDLLKATDNAAALTAMLMMKYNIPIENVVQHNHWSGKDCPRRIRAGEPYGWTAFLEKVKSFVISETPQPAAPTTEIVHVEYQAYSDGKWLPWVEDCNDVNSDGYAGIKGKAITAIRVGLSKGHIKYRAHTKNGKWLPWVTDYNTTNTSGYAGVLGKEIDMLQMTISDLPGYAVEYRVAPVGKDYFPWVRDFNETNSNGYAGVKGKAFDRLQVRVVKI